MSRKSPRVVRKVCDGEGLPTRRDHSTEALADLETGCEHDLVVVAPRSADHQLVAFHEAKADGLRPQEASTGFGDALEQRRDRLNPRELATGAQERLEPALVMLRLFQQTGVVDADGGLAGEQAHQLLVFRREVAFAVEEDGEDVHEEIAGDERKTGKASEARRILADVDDVLGDPRFDDRPDQPLAVTDDAKLRRQLFQLGTDSKAPLIAKHPAYRIGHPDARHRGAEQGRRGSRHGLNDPWAVAGRRHEVRQRAEGLELLRALLRLPVESRVLQRDRRLGRKRPDDVQVL